MAPIPLLAPFSKLVFGPCRMRPNLFQDSMIVHRRRRLMAFRTPIKVCFADIDNAGIVYYPRFMHYFHLAMEEFFAAEIGIDYADVLHKHNLSLPTIHLESDFRRRMRYGDHINMEVRVIHIGKTSIT